MSKEENSFQIIFEPHFSEKSSFLTEKRNVLVLKVKKNSNKSSIKFAIQTLFKVKVNKIRTLIVKGKRKIHKRCEGSRSDWKKSYVILEKNQNLELFKKASDLK